MLPQILLAYYIFFMFIMLYQVSW